MKAKFLIPLVVFIILVGFLAVGLQLKPSEVPSPLIGKPAPAFTLPTLADPKKTFSPSDFKGKVWLFNVWASWCVACKEEHPVLMNLAKQNRVAIVGLDYKDQRDAALTFLQRGGDPYLLSVVDQNGRVGIDYGVYGVPETFLIDREGVIRYKHIGPVTPRVLEEKILPLVVVLSKP
ncbi:MAG: DsbE family thiol:disulfide interchange protein [Burkholderiaceae bacterium]|jgi:cytochrome c biogenesis protein CcmG/thiol:disulfide interchange protein DsbE